MKYAKSIHNLEYPVKPLINILIITDGFPPDQNPDPYPKHTVDSPAPWRR